METICESDESSPQNIQMASDWINYFHNHKNVITCKRFLCLFCTFQFKYQSDIADNFYYNYKYYHHAKAVAYGILEIKRYGENNIQIYGELTLTVWRLINQASN